jgi:hypothetical protein
LKLEERIKKKIPKHETSKNFNMEMISHKEAGRRIPAKFERTRACAILKVVAVIFFCRLRSYL